MHPLIKWPGGKSREYENIKNLIPTDINTYIEPFFGGGGIYYKLKPKKAIINDIDTNLMTFYKLLKQQNKEFKKILEHIASDWENLSIISDSVITLLRKYKNNIDEIKISKDISSIKRNVKLPKLINGQEDYWELLKEGIVNKFRRIINLEVKSGLFDEKDFYRQIVAATKGAYYYYLRDKFLPKNIEQKIAQFYFIREYCFGSMFRFNKAGKFNIPYGGASYNEKSFVNKINYSLSKDVCNLLSNTDIYSLDYVALFRDINKSIKKRDFCFFDPPYDTEFSEYSQHSFGKTEQEDLSKLFGKLQCRAMMIIKKTDFIEKIYRKQQKINKKIIIDEYEKNYSYNVRGRNKRIVTHLLILNYRPLSEHKKILSDPRLF